MGAMGLVLALLLLVSNEHLADLMKEGDDRWRGHPVFSRFEPSDGPLATDQGRWWALRAWVLVSGAGFAIVGAGLAGRALLGLV